MCNLAVPVILTECVWFFRKEKKKKFLYQKYIGGLWAVVFYF